MKPLGDENLILIGMPGTGTSTVGEHLVRFFSLHYSPGTRIEVFSNPLNG